MKIEHKMTLPNGDVIYEGEYGVNAEGNKVGPMRFRGAYTELPWVDEVGWSYDACGKYFRYGHNITDLNIIAKWVETPQEDTPKKWGDMTDAPYMVDSNGADILLMPCDNGGWVVQKARLEIGLVPETLGAFSSTGDMLKALSDHLLSKSGGVDQ